MSLVAEEPKGDTHSDQGSLRKQAPATRLNNLVRNYP
jgi:hypothetical protein